MYLELVIFFLILVIQISIALYAWSIRSKLKQRYSNALGSSVNVSETLEEMLELMDRFNLIIKVAKSLDGPVFLRNGILYINKDSIYRSDLNS